MRIYIFKSETRKDLRAFAADLAGSKLPQNHGPWTATGAIGPDNAPPHNFSRTAMRKQSMPRDSSSGAWSRRPKPGPEANSIELSKAAIMTESDKIRGIITAPRWPATPHQ